jgi:signal peptidase II
VRPVTDWFNLVRVHNTGAAFSFLAGASGWQRWFFVGLGLAASAFIVWMLRSHPTQKLFCFSVSMIMGGALGNVIDRLLHGYVVDFLQFRLALAAGLPRRVLPQLQHRRQRDHRRGGGLDPG